MSTFDTGLTTDISVARLGKPRGFAPLDSDNKIPTIHLPAGNVGVQVYTVADEAERLALTPNEGDEVIQSDNGSQWLFDGTVYIQRSSGGGNNNFIPGAQDIITFNREDITADKTLLSDENVYQHIICSNPGLLVNLPNDPINGTHFVIKNSENSLQSFITNSITLQPGDIYDVKYDGVEWVTI